jgi:hypothetical protein
MKKLILLLLFTIFANIHLYSLEIPTINTLTPKQNLPLNRSLAKIDRIFQKYADQNSNFYCGHKINELMKKVKSDNQKLTHANKKQFLLTAIQPLLHELEATFGTILDIKTHEIDFEIMENLPGSLVSTLDTQMQHLKQLCKHQIRQHYFFTIPD